MIRIKANGKVIEASSGKDAARITRVKLEEAWYRANVQAGPAGVVQSEGAK